MNVSVRSAGFLTSVQDLGRAGFRQHGVSVGGALDPHALTTANLLVGNEPAAAGIELTLGRIQLAFADDRIVAWCGGNFDVEAAGVKLASGHTVLVRAGDELHATSLENGARAWLAMSGGVDVPVVLGSRATDLRSGFGGFEGRALINGDLLALGMQPITSASLATKLSQSRISTWAAPSEWASTAPRHPFLRIVRGADWHRFGATATNALLTGAFTVTKDSDRMGARLEGARIVPREKRELLSEPVAPGTIQIPADGQPIVLLRDCQTIGGYPKIAHVITVDLSAAAQLIPGTVARFAEVTLAEAQQLLIERDADLAWFRAGVALKFR